ncbi:uncharacterized protein LOC6525613 [Drosophila yakuba]|uniref:Uncharacterized protein n=1 Tax=Drosophila yakuba TaxID=7245 RepID=B4Q248_DROYA|nr:uncharacterized protein LOC6525613 [Drosophila yakuba]EDX02556.2 uncharacterized protein Dyak_GE17639 [Drosophila yakuba]
MSWLTKIVIIFILLLQIQLAQLIRYLDEGDTFDGFSSIFQKPKKQRSWDLEEELDPDRDQWKGNANMDSQSGICPAENPHDVRYEKKNRCKTAKKIVKDEDDDEDADPAANSDSDDDSNDCHEDDGVDEAVGEEVTEEISFEDEAFVARINCLLGALHKHTKAMTDNLKVLQSRLTKKKDTSCRSNHHGTTPTEHPIVKWSKKPDFYGLSEPCGDERCYADESAMMHKDVPPEVPLTEDRRVLVPPLLQLFHGPAQLQATLNSGQDITGSKSRYWMPSPESSPEVQASSPVQPEEKTPIRYEEYEARLRRLMDNRDEIERNVMKMMNPSK